MKLTSIFESGQRDTITVTIPLIIKLLEWAREESKSDIEIHELVEQLAKMPGTVDSAVYDNLMTHNSR